MLSRIKTKLTETDRKILTAHEDIVDGIAAFLGSHCEVTLHSFEDPEHAIIKIVNNQHTNRTTGSPLSEQGAQIVLDYLGQQATGPLLLHHQQCQGRTDALAVYGYCQ